MPSFDAVLQKTLDDIEKAGGTKLQYSNAIKNALGPDRRLRCKRDANSSAANPWATGVEFLNVGSVGELKIEGGNVTSFGKLRDTQISQDSLLDSGACVLRLEGNGHWLQGTLGLTGAGKEYSLPANFIGSQGVACADIGIKAPRDMASGTGPKAPNKDPKTPSYFIIENLTDIGNPVTSRVNFDKRLPNLVFQDAEVADNMGDVRVTLNNSIGRLGEFEVGGILFSMNPVVNSVPTEVLHQVLIGFKPTEANWPNYPTSSGYIDAVSDTFMPPFKIYLYAVDGSLLHTFQMRDGLPINDPSLGVNYTETKPSRPLLTCAAMLPWQSRKPKLSSKAAKYFAGMEEDVLRPTLSRFKTAYNMALPPIGGSGNVNALGHWFAVPKWPQAPATLDFSNNDPYLWPTTEEYAPYGNNRTVGIHLSIGWGYEPGSYALHDRYTGPGGIRSDRAFIPQTLCAYFTDPVYTRPYKNETIEELTDHWNLAYFNHPQYFITDLTSFATIPAKEVMNSEWSFGRGTYYGGNASYTPGGKDTTIPMFALGASGATNTMYRDKNGRWPWNGDAYDHLHNYWTPGWTGLMFNSPMHAYASMHRSLTSILTQLAQTGTSGHWKGMFMTRQHTWRLEHQLMGWKLAADHPLFINKVDFEKRLQEELEAIYREIVVISRNPPPGDEGEFYHAFNNLGCWTQIRDNYYNTTYIGTSATENTNVITLQRDLNSQGVRDVDVTWNFSTWLSNGKDRPVSPTNPHFVKIYPANTPANQLPTLPVHEIIGVDSVNHTITLRNPVAMENLQAGYIVKTIPTYYRAIGSAGQMFYMAHALQFMRQIGLFKVMRQKSQACEEALMYMIKCLDKFSIDWVLDTDGVPQYYYPIATLAATDSNAYSETCRSWALHAQSYSQKEGLEDFITNLDGSIGDVRDLNEHNRAQWVIMRDLYFPEIPVERGGTALTDAVAKFRGYYAKKDAHWATIFNDPAKNAFQKRAADWSGRLPSLGFIKAPIILEGI